MGRNVSLSTQLREDDVLQASWLKFTMYLAHNQPHGIDGIESADFLTETQKRDILYNNAVRFLRFNTKG